MRCRIEAGISGVPYYPANYLTPSFGSSVVGVPATFTMTVAHQDGPTNLQFLQLLVNAPLSGGGGCYLMYDRGSNSVILAYPDPASGSGWLVPGSPQTAYNARCTLHASGSSASSSGNTLTVRWQVTFSSAALGTHNLWTLACDYAGACANGGWTDSGDYTVGVNSAPTYVSLTPLNGSGPAQAFTLTMYDANGIDDFQYLQLLINANFSGADGCYLLYDRPSNKVGLAYQTSGDWMTPGSGATSSNAQCTLHAGQSSVSSPSGALAVTWYVSFGAGFTGGKNVWVLGGDRSGVQAQGGWQLKTSYTVSAPMPPSAATDNVTFAGGSKNPPAQASELKCGQPTCQAYYSAVRQSSATQTYAESYTRSVGASATAYYNYAKSTLLDQANNVVASCATWAQSYADAWATGRVPCSGFVNLDYTKRYTAKGEHYSVVPGVGYTSTVVSYDTLGFAEAGKTSTFSNIPLSANSDFQTASGPGVYAIVSDSLVADGSSAAYVQRNQNSVSISITVPTSARRGLHLVTFPTTDKYGYAASNPYFSFIAYDRMPSLISVSPTSAVAGGETSLSITGTGCGDRPTVIVGATEYSNGVLSTNTQGQQVVTVPITLPSTAAGTTQQVSVRSNGAGGQPFSGPPLNGTLGSATSNSIQISVVARPVISGAKDIWYLAGLGSVCNPDDTPQQTLVCYYDTTQLSVSAPSGAFATWSVTPVYPGTTEASVAWGCVGAQCATINLSSMVRPAGCGQVKVRATVNGIQSDEFTINIDSPDYLAFNPASNVRHLAAVDPCDPNTLGYLTVISYLLVSACGNGMFYMSANEKLSNPVNNPAIFTNWPTYPNTGLQSLTTSGNGSYTTTWACGQILWQVLCPSRYLPHRQEPLCLSYG